MERAKHDCTPNCRQNVELPVTEALQLNLATTMRDPLGRNSTAGLFIPHALLVAGSPSGTNGPSGEPAWAMLGGATASPGAIDPCWNAPSVQDSIGPCAGLVQTSAGGTSVLPLPEWQCIGGTLSCGSPVPMW